MFANVVRIGRSPVSVDPHIAADAPPQLLQFLQESSDAGLKFWIVCGRGQQYTDASSAGGLLRARRERPRQRRTNNCLSEIASSHCLPPSGITPNWLSTQAIRTGNGEQRNRVQRPICTAKILGRACLHRVKNGPAGGVRPSWWTASGG